MRAQQDAVSNAGHRVRLGWLPVMCCVRVRVCVWGNENGGKGKYILF